MIGLIDYDLQSSTSTHLTYPNLEIMKLASYYQIEENTFCRLIPLDEQNLSGYDKIYIFSESEIPITLPDNIKRAENIYYGGTGLTNGQYCPFENPIIDHTLPRTAIYKNYLKEKYNDGIKTKIIANLLDATYYRYMAGDEVLPLPAIKKQKQFFLYDTNFFSNDWEKIINKIISIGPSSIICIHPIVCSTLKQFFTVRSYNKISRSNRFVLDLKIPLADINYMFKKYEKLFLAEITKTSTVYIQLGGSYISSFEYFKDFIYKINLLYSFWSHKIPIKLIYKYPLIGYKNPLQNLSQRVVTWSQENADKKTINERIEVKNKTANHIYKEERDLLLKFHPAAADLFTQTRSDLQQRGVWRI